MRPGPRGSPPKINPRFRKAGRRPDGTIRVPEDRAEPDAAVGLRPPSAPWPRGARTRPGGGRRVPARRPRRCRRQPGRAPSGSPSGEPSLIPTVLVARREGRRDHGRRPDDEKTETQRGDSHNDAHDCQQDAPRTDTYRSPRGPKKNASTNLAPTLPSFIEPSSLHPFEGEPEDLVRELQIDVLSSLRVAVGEYEPPPRLAPAAWPLLARRPPFHLPDVNHRANGRTTSVEPLLRRSLPLRRIVAKTPTRVKARLQPRHANGEPAGPGRGREPARLHEVTASATPPDARRPRACRPG